VAKLLPKPYPDIDGNTDAYKLSWMKDPVAKEKSPLALWDLHYLDNLTESDYRLIPEPDKTELMMDLSPLVVRQASGLQKTEGLIARERRQSWPSLSTMRLSIRSSTFIPNTPVTRSLH
jgi:hypothetical protein